jgi:hypothetical protein
MPTGHTDKSADAGRNVNTGLFVNDVPEVQLGPGFARTFDALNDLLRLPANWDGFGAPPIDPRIAHRALGVLDRVMSASTPAPSVVPTSRGAVQFEWHTRGIDLEVEFLSDKQFRASFEDLRTGAQWDAELSFDAGRQELEALADAVRLLSRD